MRKRSANEDKPQNGKILYNAEKRQLTAVAVGDITILDPVSARTEEGFLRIKTIINESDVAYGHLEGVITEDEGYPSHDSGDYVKLHPATAHEIKSLGIDAVSAAGNHSMDYAVGGLSATIKNLDMAGIAHAGTGRNLTEARAPAYVTSPNGKIAFISTCSTFSPWARAGKQRHDCAGRPGINPLRYETRYIVDKQALQDLRRISEMLGFEEEKAKKANFGMFWRRMARDTENEFHFIATDSVGTKYNKFVAGEKPDIEIVVDESDARAMIQSIKDAKRQADWIFVALHSHESDKERTDPPRFWRPFALACIDAGADAIIGTGPHILRGIEIYHKRPIFYSLGNFIMQYELIRTYPADFYERYGLNPDYTPEEAWAEFSQNDTCGYAVDKYFWQSTCAQFSFKDDELKQIKLYPLTLGFGKRRGQRGFPLIAEADEAREIIERLQELSAPYGTEIRFKEGIGIVEV